MAAWDLSSGQTYGVRLVGHAQCQRRLRHMSAQGLREFRSVLLPHATDPHDPKAVQALARSGGSVGYLAAEDAAAYLAALQFLQRHQLVAACRAKLIDSDAEIRVLLDLKDADAALDELTRRIHSPLVGRIDETDESREPEMPQTVLPRRLR
jgi:hypothetical protein